MLLPNLFGRAAAGLDDAGTLWKCTLSYILKGSRLLAAMQKLSEQDYVRARPLLDDLREYNVSIDGVLNGFNPGAVYVDNPVDPQVVLLTSPEGTYLAGKVPTPQQVSALKTLIADLMVKHDFEIIWLQCSAVWERHLTELLPLPPLHFARQHYVCTAVALDWRAFVPAAFSVQPVSSTLLSRPALIIPEHLHDWMQGNWESTAAFLQHGFGMVTEDQTAHKVVSWSLCDCIGAEACEIGIQTDPAYRRRGLAAVTAAAAAAHALAQGFRLVGWHCNADNAGSRHTALKVGFVLEREYFCHAAFRSAAVHWAEAGHLQLAQGNYAAAADLFVRAAGAGEQPDWGHYIPFYAACMFARLGDYPAAWQWLHQAVDRGFGDHSALAQSAALEPLKADSAWTALLERVTQQADSG